MRLTPSVTVAVIAAAVLLLYGQALDRSPIYLHYDEVYFGLQAHSIATSGRDMEGRLLPLYFHIHDDVWFQPVIVYFTALFLKVLPLSEWTIRLPTVFVGVADIVLMYFVATRIFKRPLLGLAAAALLALTPAHFIHSRLAMDYLYPVLFVLAWLLCLGTFLERRQPWIVWLGTTFLGIGFYSYLASIVMMPVYLALTCVVLVQRVEGATRLRRIGLIAALGFALPLVPLVWWVAGHPTVHAEQIRRYQLGSFFAPTSLANHLSVYYSYFNPSFLFISGDASGIDSTRRAGVFLLPLLALIPIGIHRMSGRWREGTNLVLLLGFVSAPAAASLVDENYRIARALVMLPFAVLIATFGIQAIVVGGAGGAGSTGGNERWTRRSLGLVVLGVALGGVQFAYFYGDYMTRYRARASAVFERNRRGALEEIIGRDRRTPAPAVYLSKSVHWLDYYWKFYLIKYGREDLLARTVYFDPEHWDTHGAPHGSPILCDLSQPADEALARSGGSHDLTTIREPDGTASFVVFER